MPIHILNAAGNITFNSDACVNGVCGGSFFVPAGASFYRQWPTLVGCSLRVVFHHKPDIFDVSSYEKGISYPAGIPTVSLTPNSLARFMTIWIVGAPTIQNIPGVQAVATSNGGVAINPAARGMNYIGRAAYHHDDGLSAGLKYYRIAHPEEPLMAVRLDDSRSVVPTVVTQVSSGVWEIGVAHRKISPDPGAGAFLDADVYCFGRPTSPQASPQFAVWAPDTSLAYDIARPGLLVAHDLCEFGAKPDLFASNVVSVSVSRTSVMGVIGASNYVYEYYQYNGDEQDGSPGTYTMDRGTAAWRWVPAGLAMTFGWSDTQIVTVSPGNSHAYEFYDLYVPSTAILVDLSGL